LQTAAGAAAFGAVMGTGLLHPGEAQAAAPGIGLAEPIPATADFFGVSSHVQFPPVLGGPDADPGTVFNFQGSVGAALISGTCEQRNRRTGDTRTLPYMMNDMRFMKGFFRGRDGHKRGATFALVWIDVYEPPSSGGAQITDFNPGVRQNGLFWTVVMGDDDVNVDLAAGTATLHGRDLHIKDYHEFENAILGNGEPATPSLVSFTVKWTATGGVQHFENPSQQYRGVLRPAMAQMDWTARSGIFEYTSAPLETSATDPFAWLGTESNGSFFL
jgi:hypothetical protein